MWKLPPFWFPFFQSFRRKTSASWRRNETLANFDKEEKTKAKIHFTKNKQFDFWGKIGALDDPSKAQLEREGETLKLQ